jgi:hypothetical protein
MNALVGDMEVSFDCRYYGDLSNIKKGKQNYCLLAKLIFSDDTIVVYGEFYKNNGSFMVNANAIYRLDLHPEDPAVFESYLHGKGKILSVQEGSVFKEFPDMLDLRNCYVVKVEIENIRGGKIPFSNVFVSIPSVAKSISKYQPGIAIEFNGAFRNYRPDIAGVFIHSYGLPMFINAQPASGGNHVMKMKKRKVNVLPATPPATNNATNGSSSVEDELI